MEAEAIYYSLENNVPIVLPKSRPWDSPSPHLLLYFHLPSKHLRLVLFFIFIS